MHVDHDSEHVPFVDGKSTLFSSILLLLCGVNFLGHEAKLMVSSGVDFDVSSVSSPLFLQRLHISALHALSMRV